MFLHIVLHIIQLVFQICISDFSKKVHSCIDTSIFTFVFMHLDFNNSCKTLSYILSYVITKQRLF